VGKPVLKHIVGNTYVIQAPVVMGVYVRDGKAILIDSGNDREAGRQILSILIEQGWTLELIINTHSNADHIGGNGFLQKRTHCRIAATPLEAAFIQNPILEPSFLYGGFPTGDLQSKFLMAKPSNVTDIIASTGSVLETGLQAYALPGHFFEMVGIGTPDSVIFLADSLFPEHIISKYHIIFLYDIEAQLETLRTLLSMDGDWYIPSHGKPMKDIGRLVQVNREKIEEIVDTVRDLCRSRVFDEILAGLCDAYSIELNAEQSVLVGSTLRSYLSYLKNQGHVECMYDGGRVLWKAKT
jgi:glyoxylase-like metal-dependent hydrolase (beta-lactamase superfamily II)